MKNSLSHKLFFLILLTSFVFTTNRALSESVDNLKAKIADKNSEIDILEQEIGRLDKNIRETEGERKSLGTELKQVDAVRKKLDTDIKVTGKKIDLTVLNIKELESEIQDKNNSIKNGQGAVSEAVRLIHEIDSDTLIEKILEGGRLSFLWNEINNLEYTELKIGDHVKDLRSIRQGLELNKFRLEEEKKKQTNLKNQLRDQKNIAEENLKLKNKLLKETKNREDNYRRLLSETEARKRAVENELAAYESELRVAIDPTSLPTSGTKILSWPLDKVRITQYFGDTEFSRQNSHVYNGKGHNGIDLGASIGTPLKSAAEGIVVGVGDTDPVCYGASYGKWVMIEHGNGLSTIYGHLSLIKVSPGQSVLRGELIGYTGKSGYATGPHLHFTLAATEAVKIGSLKSKVRGCGTYTIPLGPFNGYLNPLSYL